MPPFPGREDRRQMMAVTRYEAVHSTRNGVPPAPEPERLVPRMASKRRR